jgi:hypothetical protein
MVLKFYKTNTSTIHHNTTQLYTHKHFMNFNTICNHVFLKHTFVILDYSLISRMYYTR